MMLCAWCRRVLAVRDDRCYRCGEALGARSRTTATLRPGWLVPARVVAVIAAPTEEVAAHLAEQGMTGIAVNPETGELVRVAGLDSPNCPPAVYLARFRRLSAAEFLGVQEPRPFSVQTDQIRVPVFVLQARVELGAIRVRDQIWPNARLSGMAVILD